MNAGQLLGEVEHLVNFNILILLDELLSFLSELDILWLLVQFAWLHLPSWDSHNEIAPVFGLCRDLRKWYLDCLLFYRGAWLLLFDLLCAFRQSMRVDAARAEFARTILEEVIALLLLLCRIGIAGIILRLIYRLIAFNFMLFLRTMSSSGVSHNWLFSGSSG